MATRSPLSPSEQRFWLLDRIGGEQRRSHLLLALEGDLDVEALRRALKLLCVRHAALRTVYRDTPEGAVREELASAQLSLAVEDLEQEGAELAWFRRHAAPPFDLSSAPLARAALLRLEARSHRLLLVVHHLLVDDASVGVLLRDLAALYDEATGCGPALGPPPAPFSEAVRRQRAALESGELRESVDYWRQTLEGMPPPAEVRGERVGRPGRTSNPGLASVQRTLGAPDVERLSKLCRSERTTPFIVVLGTLQALLAHRTGQRDVVVATVLSNRLDAQFDSTVGLLSNTALLRTSLEGEPAFRELLRRARVTLLGALEHCAVPFETVLEGVPASLRGDSEGLVKIVVAEQEVTAAVTTASGLRVQPLSVPETEAMVDLVLLLEHKGDRVSLCWDYRTSLYDRSSIEALADQFEQLLRSGVEDPSRPLAALQLASPARVEALLDAARGRPTQHGGRSLPERFSAWAKSQPEATAVVFEGRTLTYGQLDAAATSLARRLVALGCRREGAVAVALDRSVERVVACVGILKAGAAYVPLPLDSPRSRRLQLLQMSGATHVVTVAAAAGEVPDGPWQVLCLEALEREASPSQALPEVHPDQVANILFTSGSTGVPKGVAVTHRGVLRLALDPDWSAGPGARFLHAAHFGFDASTFELMTPLCTGGAVVVAPPGPLGHEQLSRLLESQQVTHALLTTTFFNSFVDSEAPFPDTLRTLVVGGEAMSPRHAALALARYRGALFNAYGPTEAAVCIAQQRLTGALAPLRHVPVGSPALGAQLYVVRQDGSLAPRGVVGEILIGGEALARGYVGQPALTAERFIPDALSGAKGARLYRTGDLGFYGEGAQVFCVGRVDRQVKVRGFRIEPGEVEAVLLEHPGVRQALVTVELTPAGEPVLAGYVEGDASEEALEAFLAQRLPSFLRPQRLLCQPSFPRMPSGKVDVARLAAAVQRPRRADLAVRSASAEEARLAEVWKELLHVDSVAPADNFFALGGSSLLVARMASRVRAQWGKELPLQQVFLAPTLEGVARSLEALPLAAPELALGHSQETTAPLSFAQERLWLFHALMGPSAVYNISDAFDVQGPLDLPALDVALEQLVLRHDQLRTCVETTGGVARQRVEPSARVRVALSQLGPGEEVEAWLRREAAVPFDLAAAPLMRVQVLRRADRGHTLLLTLHHLIADGWSLGLLYEELSALYRGAASRDALPAAPAHRYADFALWQRRRHEAGLLQPALDYWRGQLDGATVALNLPVERRNRNEVSFKSGVVRTTVGSELTLDLRRLAGQQGVTLQMVALAVFQALLHRYTGQSDIVVASGSAGRGRGELDRILGYFVSLLPIRARFSGELTGSQLFAQVKALTLAALMHQEVSPRELLALARPAGGGGWGGGWPVGFFFQNAGGQPLALEGVTLERRTLETEACSFELAVAVEEVDGGLALRWEFCSDLFEERTLREMAGHFHALLASAVRAPSARVAEWEHALPGARERLNEALASHDRALPEEDLAVLLQRRLRSQPDSPALIADGQQLSCLQLNARANQLAGVLRAQGARPETCVALALGRSVEWAACMLGILKSGAARVAVDPQLPQERCAQLLALARPAVIVTARRYAAQFEGLAPLVVVEELPWPSGDVEDLPVVGSAESLSQVVFTSGSTGTPKGVMLTRRALLNAFQWSQRFNGLRPGDRVLQLHSISFDVALLETLGNWFGGATVVLPPDPLPATAQAFFAFAEQTGLTAFDLSTAYWHALAADLTRNPARVPERVRYLTVGGERAHLSALAPWSAASPHGMRWLNGYGPTETTILSTRYDLRPGQAPRGESPIGHAIDNTQLYVLDEQMRPLPQGAVGELFIGGAGLARGYLFSAALTAERFVPNPLARTPGERLYRTGDRVRVLSDGSLDFVGRGDWQVKIRGFRVELGEVESALRRLDGVKEAVAVAAPGPDGTLRLLAYVTAVGEVEGALLSRQLSARLPPYMVPQVITVLDAFPRMATGKVDRERLPSARLVSQEEHQPATTDTQRALCAIWCEVLALERVSISSDFFALGGHSLSVVQVASRVREQLGRELPPRLLFEARTVEALARELDAGVQASGVRKAQRPIARVAREGLHPLTPSQERLWFLNELAPGSSWFNVPLHYRLHGHVDVNALQGALSALVLRHESLRTRFSTVEGQARQSVEPSHSPLVEHDLQALPPAEREARAAELLQADLSQGFDLASGRLLRASLVTLSSQEHLLFVCLHHIAADGGSIPLLLEELAALYNGLRGGKAAALPAPGLQPIDLAHWQREPGTGEGLAYWKRKLAGAPPVVELPSDRPRAALQLHQGACREYVLGAPLAAAASAFAAAEGGTLFMVLLSAFKLLIKRLSAQSDVVVGSPVANRGRGELESMVGCLVNTLVLRTDLSGSPSFREVFRRVKETAVGAYAHQDVPFEKLVQELAPRREVGQAPLCQLLLSLAPPSSERTDWDGVKLAPLTSAAQAAGATEFDLSLLFGTTARGLTATVLYSQDLFDPETVDRLMGHYQTLLQSALAAPQLNADWLSLLDAQQRARFLPAPLPARGAGRLEALVEQQVLRVPEAIAVSARGVSLTYAQLWRRAGALAAQLVARRLPPECKVAVYLEPSVERVVALLAVLRAQAAFVALDPAYRSDRLSFVIEDSRAAAVITSADLAPELPEALARQLLILSDEEVTADVSPGAAPRPLFADELAYLLYTSGSTGVPKGVSVTHRGICEQLLWGADFMALTGRDCVLHSSSIGFDVAVMEVFTPLVVGARLAIADRAVAQDADGLARFIAEEQVSIIVGLVASLMQAVVESPDFGRCTSLRHVMQGGEALPEATRDAFLRTSAAALHNCYGATEISIDGTCATFDRTDAGTPVSIGTSIPGLAAYVLDESLEPTPVGVTGEIHFAGSKLARGYWARPGLTAERFVPNPFSQRRGERLYKTGDLARWRPDGHIEFLGRRDSQVKIRGFRVELGDVEAALLANPGVRLARVTKVDGERLWAYIVRTPGAAEVPPSSLRELLRAKLPPYMVPAGISVLDAMPLLPSGKVDVRALPPPREPLPARGGPGDRGADSALASVWREVLGVPAVRAEDDFFELGGHSLLLVRLQNQIRTVLGREVSILELMRRPKLAQMEELLAAGPRRAPPEPAHPPARRQVRRRGAAAGEAE